MPCNARYFFFAGVLRGVEGAAVAVALAFGERLVAPVFAAPVLAAPVFAAPVFAAPEALFADEVVPAAFFLVDRVAGAFLAAGFFVAGLAFGERVAVVLPAVPVFDFDAAPLLDAAAFLFAISIGSFESATVLLKNFISVAHQDEVCCLRRFVTKPTNLRFGSSSWSVL